MAWDVAKLPVDQNEIGKLLPRENEGAESGVNGCRGHSKAFKDTMAEAQHFRVHSGDKRPAARLAALGGGEL